MSHIETVETVVTDLDALKAACKRMGVEFLPNKRTYTWYGRRVGNEPLPGGLTEDDLGKCDHAIKIPGVNYEVGVVPLRQHTPEQIALARKTGTPLPPLKGFTFAYDFYGNGPVHDGMKLKEKFGAKLSKLVDAYSLEALKAKARAKGYMTRETTIKGKTALVVGVP